MDATYYSVETIRTSLGLAFDVTAPCGCVWSVAERDNPLPFGILTLCDRQKCVFRWEEAAAAVARADGRPRLLPMVTTEAPKPEPPMTGVCVP